MRSILHIDMDAFFASVEQRDNPALRGKPVIVGAPRDQRGVVSTCSYEARVFGVHSAMPSRTAAKLCPQGIFITPDFHRYSEASHKVMAIIGRYSPLLEQVSVDEAYLDVTGVRRLFGEAEEIGARIRREIRAEVGLPASVGIGPTKSIAKICSELAKPDGLKAAPQDREGLLTFLAPLPVGSLFGVGKVTRAGLERYGIRTIGDVQRADPSLLRLAAGAAGAEYLRAQAFGEDAREVDAEGREEKQISREFTFLVDETSREEVRRRLRTLVEEVGTQLREEGKWAGLVKLKLRWTDFTTITRQRKLDRPIQDDFALSEVAEGLFAKERLISAVRLVGVGVGDLGTDPGAPVLDLFGGTPDGEEAREKREKLSKALDAIRGRLGHDSIHRG